MPDPRSGAGLWCSAPTRPGDLRHQVPRVRSAALRHDRPSRAPWTPELARREAKRLLGLVANGKDPADEKAKARLRATDTLSVIADQYLPERQERLMHRTYSEVERYLLVSWTPASGRRFSISPAVIARLVSADIASVHGGGLSGLRPDGPCPPCSTGQYAKASTHCREPCSPAPTSPRSRQKAGSGFCRNRSYRPSGRPVATTIADASCACCYSQPNDVMK